MNMILGVVGSDLQQRRAVTVVRREAFAAAKEFQWHDPKALEWGPEDDHATVIGLWSDSGELMATVRATVLPSALAAESIIEYPIQHLALPGPLMLLTRAATHPAYQRAGSNALLRYAYLSAATQTPLQSVITQVYDHAPRLRIMQEVGFTLTPLHRGWDSEAKAITQPLLAWMLRPTLETGAAVALAGQAEAALHTRFDIQSIVTSLKRQLRQWKLAPTDVHQPIATDTRR